MNTQMSNALSTGDNTPVVLVGSSNIEVREVEFLGDNILAIKEDEKVYAGVGYICKGLGLSEGQMKNERKKIQEDVVLQKGGRNLILPTNGGNQEVLAIDIDYLPIWLAKISITPKMKEQQSKLVEKLVEYQLKAKDVLAQAFVHNKPTSAMEELRLHYKALEEHTQEIQEVKQDVSDLKENMPLFNIECKELQALVKKKGTEVLGGYHSKAYDDQSIRTKVYSDIQKQLRREFGVSRYEAIKHSQLEIAKQIIANYKAPLCLTTEIGIKNCQVTLTQSVKPVQPIKLHGGQA